MCIPHLVALRERVLPLSKRAISYRSSTAHFRVPVKFVNDMVKFEAENRCPCAKALRSS